MTEASDPTITARWRGQVHVGASAPGAEPVGLERIVIRDEAAYRAFVERIPTARVQMRQPAPPSDDPLLARPVIDFTREVIVAVVRPLTVSAAPALSLAMVDGTLQVRYTAPPIPPEARPYGIGAYAALRISRPPGPIVFAQAK